MSPLAHGGELPPGPVPATFSISSPPPATDNFKVASSSIRSGAKRQN